MFKTVSVKWVFLTLASNLFLIVQKVLIRKNCGSYLYKYLATWTDKMICNFSSIFQDKRPEEVSKVTYLGSDSTPDTLRHSGSAKQK